MSEKNILRSIYHHLQKQKGISKSERSVIDSVCVELIKPKNFSVKQLKSITFVCTQILENALQSGTKEEFENIKNIIDKALGELTLKELPNDKDILQQSQSQAPKNSKRGATITPFTLPDA